MTTLPPLARYVTCNGLAIRRLIGHSENKMLCNLIKLSLPKRGSGCCAVDSLLHCSLKLTLLSCSISSVTFLFSDYGVLISIQNVQCQKEDLVFLESVKKIRVN